MDKVTITQLKSMTMEAIQDQGCFIVTWEGQQLGIFVQPETDYIDLAVKELAEMSNMVRPDKEPVAV